MVWYFTFTTVITLLALWCDLTTNISTLLVTSVLLNSIRIYPNKICMHVKIVVSLLQIASQLTAGWYGTKHIGIPISDSNKYEPYRYHKIQLSTHWWLIQYQVSIQILSFSTRHEMTKTVDRASYSCIVHDLNIFYAGMLKNLKILCPWIYTTSACRPTNHLILVTVSELQVWCVTCPVLLEW